MVGFVKKKVSSYTLGEKLKRLREEAKISLDEISKNTKVRKGYFELIEAGAYDRLPPDVYIKGFLRSYAQYLGLDQGEVVGQYVKERGIQKNIQKHQLPKSPVDKLSFPSITLSPNIMAAAFFVVLIFSGVFYFYKEIGNFSRTPKLIVAQPVGDMMINGGSIEIFGSTDKGNKILINDQQIAVGENGRFNEVVSLQQGNNLISVKAVNRFGKEEVAQYNVTAQYDQEFAHKNEDGTSVMGASSERQDKAVRVELKIREVSTWVVVEVDGKNVYSGTMLPEAVQLFEADEAILITSGKADKTFINFNGQDVGVLAQDPGLVRNVMFDKDGRKEALLSDENVGQNTADPTDIQVEKEKPKKKKKD